MKIKPARALLISLGIVATSWASPWGSRRACAWTSNVQADEPAGKPVTEQQLAEKLHFYRSLKTFKVPFKQTKMLKELKMKLKSEGTLEVAPPQRIVWQVTRPAPLQVTLDEKEIRIVSGSGTDQQTQVLKRSDAAADKSSEALTSLVAWLRLDAHLLASQYEISQQPSGMWRFKPKTGSNGFKQLEMRVNSSGHLSVLNLEEKSGDQLLIEFGKPKTR